MNCLVDLFQPNRFISQVKTKIMVMTLKKAIPIWLYKLDSVGIDEKFCIPALIVDSLMVISLMVINDLIYVPVLKG